MANLKSSKKRVLQTEKKRQANLARKTAIKTAIRNVLQAVERGEDAAKTRELLNVAQARLARAKNKGVVHANTAARKISRLTKRVNAATK